ncbi:MAG: precorrin 6A synthase [Aeromicrobium sp.]|uniref:precorrin 6A synthase n=1 Tax=Aeromicrobium sp. TaxID=1871063 RepID=UPI002604310C|nr:precorrin 6A synthase [Aeromicrobium sp.]MDF1706288.1 precorrin 6A synthase [Aeromicrobium sp.]
MVNPAGDSGPGRRDRAQLRIVGIGLGDPGHLTVEAVEALRSAAFALVTVKREGDPLAAARRAILDRYAPGLPVVEVQDPERDRSERATATAGAYEGVVSDWHEARAAAWESVLTAAFALPPSPDLRRDVQFLGGDSAQLGANLAEAGGTGVVLVWGDPAFYDSTIRVVERILARGRLAFAWDVLPGISALQLLAARHRIVLHEVGQPIAVTTARRLREAVASGADNVLVFLTGRLDLAGLEDWTIWWGANLGAESERLVSGRVGDVVPAIESARAGAKAAAGWVMDLYLLRR